MSRAVIFILVVALVSQPGIYAADGTIVVVYPEMGDPYKAAIQSIITGIESVAPNVRRYPITDDKASGTPESSINPENTIGVITLGRRGMQVVQSIHWKGPHVVGAVIRDKTINDSVSLGISLDPSPAVLIKRLHRFNPSIRRIHLVSDPSRSGWLVPQAMEAASSRGISLIVYSETSQGDAVRKYREILASADSTVDALWLPLDATTVNDETILPYVLRTSWERRLTVFSSAPHHAQRGTLFSVQPNNEALGRSLAKKLQSQVASGKHDSHGVVPLTDVLFAVNHRTAQHLGIRLKPNDYDIEYRP